MSQTKTELTLQVKMERAYHQKHHTLNLAGKNINDADILEILDFVVDRSITTLNLNANNLTCAGAQQLASFLQRDPSVLGLHLAGNKINTSGAKHLARVLPFNTHLEMLDLSSNPLQNLGIKAIARNLKKNIGLRTLWLCDTAMDDASAEHLAQALKENFELQALHLARNNIGDAGATTIMDAALDGICTLSEINFCSNQITEHGADAILCYLGESDNGLNLFMDDNKVQDAVIGEQLKQSELPNFWNRILNARCASERMRDRGKESESLTIQNCYGASR
jgi:hypothetical protein